MAKLYTPSQIAGATLLGSLVAAGWLARTNLIALGNPRRGNVALLLGVALTMALMALSFALPASLPGPVLVAPQIVTALVMSRREFQKPLEVAGTEQHSPWRALGVGVLCLLIVVVVVVAVAGGLSLMMPMQPPDG